MGHNISTKFLCGVEMKLPDLIIAGAAKCGTTALWYNLDKHPNIEMAMKSDTSVEMNYWGGTKYKHGIEWYKRRFGHAKICGEKTVAYLMKRKPFKLMHKVIPNVKIFICVRNPVDRAYSNFQMHKKAGKMTTFNMNAFNSRYANQGRYINLIENNILPFFRKDQIYICVTERMKKDPDTEMNKIFSFLGVEEFHLPKKEIGGVLLKNRSRLEDVKLNRTEQFYRVWSKHQDVLTGPLRQQLLSYYAPYNDRLFKFLGYEIKEWKN